MGRKQDMMGQSRAKQEGIARQNTALAIHTASPDLGLAIGSEFGNSRVQVWENLGRELSAQFHPHLAAFLCPQTWDELRFIAVAKGPGGFTGTRLGIVAARTLAQQLEIPLFAVSTLAAVAWDAYQNGACTDLLTPSSVSPTDRQEPPISHWSEQTIAVQMPAQRGELHTGIYSVRLQTPQTSQNLKLTEAIAPVYPPESVSSPPLLITQYPDTVLTQTQWHKVLAEWKSPYQLVCAEGGLGQTVASVLDLAYLEWQQKLRPHWSTALPVYGQSPV